MNVHQGLRAQSGQEPVHVDLITDEWTEGVDRAIFLGATRLGDFDEDGATLTTLADPGANEFDIAAPPK